MKTFCRMMLAGAVGLVILGTNSTLRAAPKSEDAMIADLDSPKEGVVVDALAHLEKEFPTSTKAFPKMKQLLTDSRSRVRRKAGRVLGALHADVSEADLNNISTMLSATDKGEVLDALKSLRGLKAQSTVPKVVPMLQNPDDNVKRDACRTLAVIGDKSVIPSIEPLLASEKKDVQKDAQDAIFALKSK